MVDKPSMFMYPLPHHAFPPPFQEISNRLLSYIFAS